MNLIFIKLKHFIEKKFDYEDETDERRGAYMIFTGNIFFLIIFINMKFGRKVGGVHPAIQQNVKI